MKREFKVGEPAIYTYCLTGVQEVCTIVGFCHVEGYYKIRFDNSSVRINGQPMTEYTARETRLTKIDETEINDILF